MKTGTRSILFGAHALWLHPWFVAGAWWKLYGFPRQPWLWVAFFVHDLGYWGCVHMDDELGEEHPWLGARVMFWLQGFWLFLQQPAFYHTNYSWPMRWWHFRRRLARGHISVSRQRVIWGNEVLYHSRFLSQRYTTKPSRLCYADKLAIALIPWWLYVSITRATGEIREYRKSSKHRAELDSPQEDLSFAADKMWFMSLQSLMRRFVERNYVAS